MYNQMGVNGFANPDFTAFVDGVIRFADMQLATGAYREIPAGIADAATVFAELQAAANASRFPALAQMIDPQAFSSVQHLLGILKKISDDIQRHTALQTQQTQPAQNNLWGVQQPAQQPTQQQIAWPPAQQVYGAQAAAPAWNNQPAPAWRTQGPAVTAIMGTASAGASALFSPGVQPVVGQAQEDNGRFSSRFSSPYDNQPLIPAQTPAQQMSEMLREKEKVMISTEPAQPSLPANVVKADSAKFVPSAQHPFSIAYDPNKMELYYRIEPNGSTTPLVKQKEDTAMDITKHFIVPTYTKVPPVGTEGLDVNVRGFEANRALDADAAQIEKLEAIPLNVAYKDDSFTSALCADELWLNNDVHIAMMRRKTSKVNVFRSCGVVMSPMVSEKNPKPFVDMLASAESFSQAAAMLQTAKEGVITSKHEHLDARMLTFINTRLTNRINNFLKKELAVSVGWMDSFVEDVRGLIEFIDKRCGETVRKALVLNQKALIKQAMAYGEAEFEKDQNSVYLPDEATDEGKEARKLSITYFYEYLTVTTVDLNSTELALDFHGDVAVGVFEQQTPMARRIAENIFLHEKTLGMQFDRHLVQTADKVVLEFIKSPTHADFYLVFAPNK